MLGLYIHIPFCKKICDYCDFHTIQGPERLHSEYLDLLNQEISDFALQHPDVIESVRTIYIGGGTPSMLSSENLNRLFQILIEHGVPMKDVDEFTMEFNPESCTEDRLAVALANGVSRASLGLQTFRQELLSRIGRSHSVDAGISALERLLSYGNLRVSADLMFNLPGQAKDVFLEDLDRLSNYPLGHISFYGLKVDPKSRLGHRISKNEEFVDEDLYGDMYLEGVELLKNKGFERYETSNFARPGEESLHNLNYWRCGEYLAFGPSAHGFLNGMRFYAPEKYAQWRGYVQNGCPSSGLTLDPIGPEERIIEYIQLSLRTKYGLNLAVLKSLNFELSPEAINRWISRKYLECSENAVILSGKGWLFMDSVVEDLFCSGRHCSKLE